MRIYTRKMKTVCKKNLEVFDFKEETEVPELALRIKSKLENPKNAIDKYTFLATAATGKGISAEEINYVPSLGIDTISIDHIATTLVEEDSSARMMPDSDDAFTVAEQLSQSSPELRTDLSGSEVTASGAAVVTAPGGAEIAAPGGEEVTAFTASTSPSNNKLNSAILDLLPSRPGAAVVTAHGGAEVTAPDEEAVTAPGEEEVTAVTESVSPSNNKLNSAILDFLPSPPELNETVDMDPDETGSMCERSSSTSDFAEDDDVLAGPSSDHCIGGWEMDHEDITAVVFDPDYVVYRGSYYTDSIISFTSSFIEMDGSTTSGDEKTFTCKWGIEDIIHIRSHWYERVEMAMVKIHVLMKDTVETGNVECTSGTELKFAVIGSGWYERLEAITSLNIAYKALWSSMLESEDALVGHSRGSFTKYLPNFDRPFEEVVYPKGDADAVSISKRDFDLLQPDTFVNDTIIDFYIKYLKNKIKPEERYRFHFFNSFFFRKLVDPDKDPLNASQGRAAFQRVRKWTRKVNLFEKDYVFIPVNYNYHWSLIIICNLGDVATYEDEDVNESIKVPCVLHMDSIRGNHTGFKGLVQSYLKEEWKERQKETSKDISSRFDNLRFISLELPQQQNSFDCGLFLLHYVELFLEQAPLHFNPFKITKSFNFLNVDWFPPSEASLKRVVIQKLICDLLENPYQEPLSTTDNDERCNLSCPTTSIHKGSVVNLTPENRNSSMPCQFSQADHGSCLGMHFPDFNQTMAFDDYKSSLTPIEEDEEGGGPFVYSQTEPALQQDDEIMPEYSSQHFSNMPPCHPPVIRSSPETSTSVCEDSIEIIDSQKIDEPLPDISKDGNINGVDDLTSSRFPNMKQTGPTGSDVQHPAKKMRMTEP